MKQLHVKHSLSLDIEAVDNRRHDYTVTKVTNSTTPHIDDVLTSNQLTTYCESEAWQVTIT